MEKQLYQYILWVHVLAGFIALFSGTMILFAKKGKGFHLVAGRFYYWGMAGVFVTTIGLLAIYPMQHRLWFFTIVAVVSFYQTFTGRRALDSKNGTEVKVRISDWLAFAIVSVGGLISIALSVWNAFQGQVFFAVLFAFFAILGISTAYQDLLVFTRRRLKVHWFFHHIGRMMGSFAATTTAFIVNIGPRFMPENLPMGVYIAMWVFPGVLIGYLSARWIRKRKNLMAFQRA